MDEKYLPVILRGMLMLDWMLGPAPTMAILELMACKCLWTYKLPSCLPTNTQKYASYKPAVSRGRRRISWLTMIIMTRLSIYTMDIRIS